METMGKCGPSRTKQNIHRWKGLMKAIQKCNLSHRVKSYGHLCQIYQNHFYFLPNFVSKFRKSYQIWGNWLRNKKVTGKNKLGVETPPPPPPSAYRLKRL